MFSPLRRPRTAAAIVVALGALGASASAASAASYSYTLSGTSKLNSVRVKGSVPITGTLTAAVSSSGAITSDVTLDSVSANLTEFGILPIQARVGFTTVGQSTGQLNGTTLTTTTNQTINLLSAKVLGVNVVTTSTCHTTKPSTITLTSNAFSLATGGTLTGTFGTSQLTGCGLLQFDLAGSFASNNNTVSETLTPR